MTGTEPGLENAAAKIAPKEAVRAPSNIGDRVLSARRPLSEDFKIMGGRQRADETWDTSRMAVALVGVSPDHVAETLAEIRKKLAEADADTQPGSLGKIIQHLEETRRKVLTTQIDPADETRVNDANRIRQQLEEEREVAGIIIARRAIDLLGDAKGPYEAFLPEAKKLSAAEGEDMLDTMVTEWYKDMATAPEQDKEWYKTKLAAAGRLKTELINEQSNANPKKQEEALARNNRGVFRPSTQWQEIPKGLAIPKGFALRMDIEAGKSYARWDNPPDMEIPYNPPSQEAQMPGKQGPAPASRIEK